MAPEVALCMKYGLSADVFSYSILLWEIISLKVPFAGFDVSEVFPTFVLLCNVFPA